MDERSSVAHLGAGRRERTHTAILTAVVEGVPAYRNGFDRAGEHQVTDWVNAAVSTFVEAAANGEEAMDRARSMAFDLGRLQARIGRGLDDLLAAYRVGTSAAWHEYADAARDAGFDAGQVADLASALFGFVDQISAASIAGHAEGVSSARRAQEEALARFADLLVAAAPAEELQRAAETTRVPLPHTAAVLIAARHDLARVLAVTPSGALTATKESASGEGIVVVPDLTPARRARLVEDLSTAQACLGPTVPARSAALSLRIAERARAMGPLAEGRDADDHLLRCAVSADPEALELLRSRTLAPLAHLSERKAAALTTTLRSWLLNLGQRGAVARELGVHPQTVRYRMDQVREAFGPDLADPATVERLVVCLAAGDDQRGR